MKKYKTKKIVLVKKKSLEDRIKKLEDKVEVIKSTNVTAK